MSGPRERRLPKVPRRAAWKRVVGLALSVVLVAVPAVAQPVATRGDEAPPLTLGGDPRVDPTAFRVTVFADALFYPYGMTELADGSLLVGTSRPSEGGYFGSIGELARFVDADADGVADGPGTVLATGLPGTVTAVRRAGSLVYAVSAPPEGTVISVLRLGATPEATLARIGSIHFGYEVPMDHATYALAVREVPDAPGRHDLFFNVGSMANDAAGVPVYLSGLIEATLADAAIYRVTVDDTGEVPIFSNLTQIATGLRNAAGIAVDPATGDLYFEDNGIDTPDDRIESFSADELNRIAVEDVGGVVEDFGFPTDYVEYRSGLRVGGHAVSPLVSFGPHGTSENEGATEIALAPPGFPAGLDDGVFVGFHGQWDEVGLANEENPLVYVDLDSGEYFHLVGNDEPAVGHLDGLLATEDALYVADLTGTGSLVATEPTGVIYRIAPANTRR